MKRKNQQQRIVILTFNDGVPFEIYGPFASIDAADVWAAAVRRTNRRVDQATIDIVAKPFNPAAAVHSDRRPRLTEARAQNGAREQQRQALLLELVAMAKTSWMLGKWLLQMDPTTGAFYWSHADMKEKRPSRGDRRPLYWSIPIVWASPYWEGADGITVQVEQKDGELLDDRTVKFDGTLTGYERIVRHVLATWDPARRV
jgi:hypothetical protein